MKIFKFVVALAVLSALVSCGSLADNQELSSNGKSLDATAYTSGLPAVQLINAKTRLQKKGLSSTYEVYLAGDIELENIAYTKNVKVVYSVDGGAWLKQMLLMSNLWETIENTGHFLLS